MEALSKEVRDWLDDLPVTVEDRAREAYSMMRGNHRGGELPGYLKHPWENIPVGYKRLLIFIANHTLKQSNQ